MDLSEIDEKYLGVKGWVLEMMTTTDKNTLDNNTTFTITMSTPGNNAANTSLNEIIRNLNLKPHKPKP